jgi:predicted N-acetyltransferase YhbS
MLQIRLAQASDTAAISSLMLGQAQHITLRPDGLGAKEILESMREPAIANNLSSLRFTYWVACDDNHVQGVISLRDGRHLYQLFVPTSLHRQGIARRLWQHLLLSLPSAAAPASITVNASLLAAPAYERFGFVTTGARTETKGIAFVPMIFTLSTFHSQEP